MGAMRVGFIGTGKKPEKPGPLGYGMAHQHAAAYKSLGGQVEIVAVADISRENAEAFCGMFGVDPAKVYTDYPKMLKNEKLDLVSICTWPRLHAPMAIACAKAGVKGVYCEKPMADDFGSARKMHETCARLGTRLGFNHQRRYGRPFRQARKLIDEGAIGKLQQVQFTCGDIYDYGTHSIDLSNYLAGEQRAKWVLAQIDYTQAKVIFGMHCENQAVVIWEYENGVMGFGATGPGRPLVNAHNRAVGSEGIVEVGPFEQGEHPTQLRIRRFGQGGWEYLDCGGEHCHGPGYIERAIGDFVACLRDGRPCELESGAAMRATEIIFGAYESSRRRARIELPPKLTDNPLVAMVEAGDLKPAGWTPAPKPKAAKKQARAAKKAKKPAKKKPAKQKAAKKKAGRRK
ncbi:MAG: Gfo/Idh/MocA family oxidoreductase [Planctomycetota bacterium]|nr:Gfo/Idh/MocA family oxidoreductase [Planctomycetota bacterium]